MRSCISLNWLVCYYGCSRIGLLAVELWRKLELRCRVETQRILGLDLHTCSLNRTCRIKCESCGSSELIPGSAVYKAQVIFAWLLCFGYNVSTFLSLITVVTLLILWSYVMMLLRLMGQKLGTVNWRMCSYSCLGSSLPPQPFFFSPSNFTHIMLSTGAGLKNLH